MHTQVLEANTDVTARTPMLRMAKHWRANGQINQAIGAYTQLMRRYPGSEEARDAATEILSLAQAYELQGQYRMAMSLYEKLERLT